MALEKHVSTQTVPAQSGAGTGKTKPYRLGIALSGGGARGFAHAGALMAIEDAGLKPDAVAGVSAGSVIAVLYPAGVKPLRMAEIFARMSFRDFVSIDFGRGGLFNIERFEDFVLRALGGIKNIEDLPIPTYIAATDIDNGCQKVFSSGRIGPRMMASCSIPIIFRPVEIDGAHYVDGGVLRNHPAWVLRDKCDTLIGINVSPLRPTQKYNSIISVALRTYNLMTKADSVREMELCDIAVDMPKIVNYGVFDLRRIKELFVMGYKSTREALRSAGMWNPSEWNDDAPKAPENH